MTDKSGLQNWHHVWFDGTNYAISHGDGGDNHVLRARVNRTTVHACGGQTWQWSELEVEQHTGNVLCCGVNIGRILAGKATVFTGEEVVALLS